MTMTAPASTQTRFEADARKACAMPAQGYAIPGIEVKHPSIQADEMDQLRVTDEQSGGWMVILYDRVSKRSAMAAAPCLGAQLRLLATALNRASPGQWSSAVFATAAPTTAPPDKVVRWHVPTNADGSLSDESRKMMLMTIPHEQVHRDQARAGSQLPRWFVEGHAEWVSRPIQRLIAPALAASERRTHGVSAATFTAPTKLKNWGGLKIKREAIRRQVSAEEQRRMDLDPTYYAPIEARSLKFGPDDLVNDDGDLTLTGARYQAAWRVFDHLERSRGKLDVRHWANGITRVRTH
jgi:hypothetical protein